MKTAIKNATGRVKGWIRKAPGGRIEAMDATGRVVGRYDPLQDRTFDVTGRTVSIGNTVACFIRLGEN